MCGDSDGVGRGKRLECSLDCCDISRRKRMEYGGDRRREKLECGGDRRSGGNRRRGRERR